MKITHILSISLFISTCLGQWIDQSEGKNKYVYNFAAGVFSSEAVAAKYCPSFMASTGEIVSSPAGINIMQHPRTCNFAEINLSHDRLFEGAIFLSRFAESAVDLSLAHVAFKFLPINTDYVENGLWLGYAGYVFWRPLWLQITQGALKKYQIAVTGNPHRQNQSVQGHSVDLFKLNLGQQDDVNIFKNSILKSIKENEKSVIVSCSRGGATAFETFVQLDVEGQSDKIAAVICEGIFDSIPNLMKNASAFQKIKMAALMYIPITKFKRDGISPIDMVEKLRTKDKPIALVTSLKDVEVPAANVVNLYRKLVESGQQNVHILILKDSDHPAYPVQQEKAVYEGFIHNFYLNYQLPYIASHADSVKGKSAFIKSRPEILGKTYERFIADYFSDNAND
jgi:hypothetical protein